MKDSPLFTVKEAAGYLRVHPNSLYVLVRAHDFPALKVGGAWRIPKDALDDWIQKQLKEKPELIGEWLSR